MIKEHERIVLSAPVPSEGFEEGMSARWFTFTRTAWHEVEFTTLDGETAAVVTVESSQVRPVGKREIAHARTLTAA